MSTKNILLLLLLAAVWSPAFLLIKFGIESYTPLMITFGRVFISFLFFCLLLIGKKENLLRYKKHWKDFAIMGLFANALPFFLISYSEQYITSSLAALLNSSVPIFTIIFAHYALDDEPFTRRKIIGIVLGLIGIGIIFLPGIQSSSFSEMGALAVIIASVCYAIAMTYSKTVTHKFPPLVLPAGQMLFASLYAFIPMMIFDRPWESIHNPSLKSTIAIICLGIFATGFSFILYYEIVKRVGAGYLSYSTLLFPVFGLLLGKTVLHEHLAISSYIGMGFIFSGLLLNSKIPRLR